MPPFGEPKKEWYGFLYDQNVVIYNLSEDQILLFILFFFFLFCFLCEPFSYINKDSFFVFSFSFLFWKISHKFTKGKVRNLANESAKNSLYHYISLLFVLIFIHRFLVTAGALKSTIYISGSLVLLNYMFQSWSTISFEWQSWCTIENFNASIIDE